MAIKVRLTQDSVKPYDKIYIIQSGLKLDKNLRVRNTKEKRIWEAGFRLWSCKALRYLR